MISIDSNLTPSTGGRISIDGSDGWVQIDLPEQIPAGMLLTPFYTSGSTPEHLLVAWANDQPSNDKAITLGQGTPMLLRNGNQIKKLWLRNTNSTTVIDVGYQFFV